jgi:hypothetical protein
MPDDEVAAPTPETGERFLLIGKRFNYGPPRVFNFSTAGCHWRLYYHHLGEGGIAFPDPAQEERYCSLSSEERKDFIATLRGLVNEAELDRVRRANRRRQLHEAIRFSTRMALRDRRRIPPTTPIHQPKAAPENRPRRRRAALASGASRRGPPAEDPELAPPPSRPPLTGAERDYLRAEVDRLVRQGIADQQVTDRAIFRALEAWGEAGVVA